MNVGYVQTEPRFGERASNFDAVRALVEGGPKLRPIDLLVLPELFTTGYVFTSREEAVSLSEPAEGPTAKFLRDIARMTGGVVVGGFAEADGRKIYNSSLIVDADRILGTYRKIHLYDREKLWFEPGDRPPALYRAGGAAFGVMICFDWYFPETMRLLMLLGAQVAAHPANLVLPYCQDAMKTRCLENRMFAVTANRIGRELRGASELYFTGASQITAVDGSVLSVAPAKEGYVDVVTIDPAAANLKQINENNDLRLDRRVELYAALLEGAKKEREGA